MNRGKNAGIGRTFQKPKNRKYALKRLWDYLYKYKFLLLIALTLTILSNSFALVGPKLLGYAINAMDFKKTGGIVLIDKVLYYAMLMVIFYIFSSIFSCTIFSNSANIACLKNVALIISINSYNNSAFFFLSFSCFI